MNILVISKWKFVKIFVRKYLLANIWIFGKVKNNYFMMNYILLERISKHASMFIFSCISCFLLFYMPILLGLNIKQKGIQMYNYIIYEIFLF